VKVADRLRRDFERIASGVPADVSVTLVHPRKRLRVSLAGDRPMPSASVIKLCVMVSALRRVAGRDWSVSEPVSASGRPLLDLVWRMITKSCNESTNELIEALGMERIDREIHGLMGLSAGTTLRRMMLDWDARERGIDNLVTTDDVASLLLAINKGAHLPRSLTDLAVGILRSQEDLSKIPGGLPDGSGAIVGNKTGGLPLVHNDAALIQEADGGTWALVVAINGLEPEDEANNAIRAIAAAAWDGLHLERGKGGAGKA